MGAVCDGAPKSYQGRLCFKLDPQLGSAALGETTGSEEPATEGGIDPGAGDEADATTDAGPELPEGAEPDLKDAAAARRQADVESAE